MASWRWSSPRDSEYGARGSCVECDVWQEPVGAIIGAPASGWYHPLGTEWLGGLRISLFGAFKKLVIPSTVVGGGRGLLPGDLGSNGFRERISVVIRSDQKIMLTYIESPLGFHNSSGPLELTLFTVFLGT